MVLGEIWLLLEIIRICSCDYDYAYVYIHTPSKCARDGVTVLRLRLALLCIVKGARGDVCEQQMNGI